MSVAIELKAHRKLDGKVSVAIIRTDNSSELWSGVVDLSAESELQRVAKDVHGKIPTMAIADIESQLRAVDRDELDVQDDNGRMWQKPNELPDPIPEVQKYDPDFLPSAIGDAVSDVAYRMQCPADFPAAAVLVALAALIGNKIGIRPKRKDDWLVIPNLWGCIVGRPSLMKSPSAAFAEKHLRRIEEIEAERMAPKIREGKKAKMIYEAQQVQGRRDLARVINKENDDTISSLAERLVECAEFKMPVSRRIVTTDSTIEKLVDLLNLHPFGMVLWRDELVSWLRGLDREDQAGVRQQFLSLWNGYGKLNVDRITRGETVCENACLSIFGCATPGGISEYVQSALRGGAGSDGLMQRFQVTVWPDDPPNKGVVDAEPNAEAMTKAEGVFERLADLDGRSVADPSCKMEEKIPWVQFDRDAQKRFIQWLESHAKRCKRDPEAIEAHLDKYKKLVPAVALVLELCDGCEKRSVGVASLDRAIRWAQYLESHAMRLYAFAASPERVLASPLLERLLQWKSGIPIRVRSIRQKGWTGLAEPKVIESTLETLEDGHWVQSVENVKTRSGGRPTTSYVLHPEAEKWMGILKCHTTETNKTGAEAGSG
jgi:hypothetical protein